MEFIIGGCFLGIIIGGFLGLMFTVDTQNKVIKIITICFYIAISSLIFTVIFKSKSDNFNNGYCPKCEIKYEAVQRKNSQTYYECPNCYYGTWY